MCSRTELAAGYQLSFSVYDEATVADWRGLNLRLANNIPNIDVLVLGIKQVKRNMYLHFQEAP